ncbi:MAG: hypothetical protein LBK53_08015 [Heliobacteriaceae bacterium]|jgi:hypothetical protein|nr:hypothetical protein [Heliobacteriaceae bacterium]
MSQYDTTPIKSDPSMYAGAATADYGPNTLMAYVVQMVQNAKSSANLSQQMPDVKAGLEENFRFNPEYRPQGETINLRG